MPHTQTRPASGMERTSGFTLIELIITMAIVVVAAGILARTLAGTAGMRAVNRENGIAVEGGRQALEAMRDQDFEQLFALYNEDADDDPGGAGTAPGPSFDVAGLIAVGGGTTGQGVVRLPAIQVEVAVEEEGAQEIGGPVATELVWQLREDVVDDELGMPRDLNGDNVIDDADHSLDYIILPVCVSVSWDGRGGERSTELHTMFTEFKKKL